MIILHVQLIIHSKRKIYVCTRTYMSTFALFSKKALLSRGMQLTWSSCPPYSIQLFEPMNQKNDPFKIKLRWNSLNYLNSLKCRHLCQLFTLVVKIQVAPPVKQEFFLHVPSGFPLRNPFLAYESYFVDHAFFRYATFFSNNPLHRTSI